MAEHHPIVKKMIPHLVEPTPKRRAQMQFVGGNSMSEQYLKLHNKIVGQHE
jgi:hypothetical protein